jgi:hypothetical protein
MTPDSEALSGTNQKKILGDFFLRLQHARSNSPPAEAKHKRLRLAQVGRMEPRTESQPLKTKKLSFRSTIGFPSYNKCGI